jgi:PAS domain S-box-containing protein
MFRLMRLWLGYRRYVEAVTQDKGKTPLREIGYWRSRLFTKFVLYSLPVSLAALIPAISIGITEGQPYLIFFDVAVALVIACIALNPRIGLKVRKGLVTFIFYLFAVVTIGNLGAFGPGAFYLLATTVFASIIFSSKLGYLSVALHFLTCSFYAVVIHMHLFPTPLSVQYTLASWISLSSNIIFLSLIFVLLIHRIIYGLESTILQELELQSKLEREATERAGLHLKLKESEGHYKSLFVQNPSPMWVVELESFRILQVNEAAIESYGFSKAEFMSMTVMDLRVQNNDVNLHKRLGQDFKSGKRHHYVTKHRRKNNTEFDVEMRTNTIVTEGKQALLAIGRDITKEKNHVKAMEEKNMKLQEIAYIQSHKVRAPLANIMGLVNLIKMTSDTQPDNELINKLDSAAEEFDQIIRRIADGTLSR